LLAGDFFVTLFAVWASFALRLELGGLFLYYFPQAVWMTVLALVIKPLVYYFFGMYRRFWAYASVKELMLVASAVSTASVFLATAVGLLTFLQQTLSPDAYRGFPLSALAIDWLLSLILVGGLRFIVRAMAEIRTMQERHGPVKHVLVVGAGDAGALVVREMQKNPHLHMRPVGFLDDDPAKVKQQIHGVPVVGRLKDLPLVLDKLHVDEVIYAIPSAPGTLLRQVTDVCRLKGVSYRTMPGLNELIGGKVSVSRLREVQITDLLRREPMQIDTERVGAMLGGQRVLVTGAGGSIGRELCRQIAAWGPAELILLGHGENSIFEALLELSETFPSLPMHPVIADVRDRGRLDAVFAEHHPQFVFHAAAHKHVPLMEVNVEEAVTNNVLGTRNVVETCLAFPEVERLVMVSTDKAVRPTSVMGATKRLAEMLVLDAAQRSGRAFSVVRFGNVLGSRGSVVPRFQAQIRRGGPITITHPEMRRYFMTIPEAVNLVLQAAAMSRGGEVFVLNMGEPVRILDLAEDLIRLSGLEPYRDIEIVFTGMRPGEKLVESLWDDGVNYQPTEHADVLLLADVEALRGRELQQAVDELTQRAREGETATVLALLDEFIPGAKVRSTPPPDMTAIY